MDYDTRGLKVMVVEHDRTILELIELRLSVAGYDTCMARSGQSAIETLRNFRPAVLVLDMDLPDVSGLVVLQTVNPKADRSMAPTLLMARKLAQADLQMAVRFGVRDCLTKPFSGADLVTRVSRLSKRPDAGAQAA
jgi:DNA-binding response OmpR family regulator